MALRACKECGQSVSAKAAACPHCGAPVKKSSNAGAGCFLILVLGGAIVVWMASRSSQSSVPSSPVAKPASPALIDSGPSESMILAMAYDTITRALKSPGSATFLPPERVTKLRANHYRVSGIVRARNALNAELQENWVVELDVNADGALPLYIKIGGDVQLDRRGGK